MVGLIEDRALFARFSPPPLAESDPNLFCRLT